MYIRGLLLCMKEDDGSNVRLLYNRCFSTTELKASQLHDKYYIPFADFVNDLSGAMSRLVSDSKKLFLPQDSDSQMNIVFAEQYKPVFALKMRDNKAMWPVVMLEQGDFLALAVPLVEVVGDPSNVPLHKIPALAPSYELLVSILEFISQNSATVTTLSQHRLKDLTMALTICCPFGLITSTDLQRLRKILRASVLPGSEMLPAELDTDSKGTPSFRPVFPADKETVSALLVERISCIQTAESMMTNISGCCWLCAELTSASPVISLPVCLPSGDENAVQLFVSPHSSIEKQQSQPMKGGSLPTANTVVLSVHPPNDWFPLFMYEARNSPEPPIFGLLIVQGSQSPFKLTFQLKPCDRIKNVELSDLSATITLPTLLCVPPRSSNVEQLNASHGDIGVDMSSGDSTKIIWQLGNTKLPIGDKPATLKGSLSTTGEQDPDTLKKVINELHATLRFTWRGGVTCSGLSMRLADAKVQPARLRPRFALEFRVETVTYRIYNTA